MDKKAILGIRSAMFLIVAFLVVVGVMTVAKWDITGKVVDKIDKISGQEASVVINTSLGEITVELDSENAPITVENFLSYVDSGFYDGLVFHRVINGFMIQGGGFDESGVQKDTNAPIKLESNNGLHNEKYTIAMARTNVPNSATSQFFINVEDNPSLDYSQNNPGYAVFGKVTAGQEVVDKIKEVKTITKNSMRDWPEEDVIIYFIKRV